MGEPAIPQPIVLVREQDFRFRVRFGADGAGTIITDEEPPLGKGEGPNPSMLLGAAIGNCLASSLLFCLSKAHIEVRQLEAEVVVSTMRNEQGRLRIRDVRVRLAPTVTEQDRERMGRCLEVFESFCLVTESVRHGVDVRVAVEARADFSAATAPVIQGAEARACAESATASRSPGRTS